MKHLTEKEKTAVTKEEFYFMSNFCSCRSFLRLQRYNNSVIVLPSEKVTAMKRGSLPEFDLRCSV